MAVAGCRRGLNHFRMAGVLASLTLSLSTPVLEAQNEQKDSKAREVITLAIEAMGGRNYLEVRNSHSQGQYFIYDRDGRKGFSTFWDWTVYEPIKSRFQSGEKKRQQVEIYNLELDKGWVLEGEDSVEEVPPEGVQSFRKSVLRDLDILLKHRANDEDVYLYYYGPQDIAGDGQHQAVEFLDAANNSVVVFFDLKSHLPSKSETQVTNQLGIRQKSESEYSNWHTIQGVHTPLRTDNFTDGKLSSQFYVKSMAYNVDIPASYFLEPVPDK